MNENIFSSPVFATVLSFLLILLVIVAPDVGLILIMVFVYFPIIGGIDLGLFTLTVTTLPVLALSLVALVPFSKSKSRINKLEPWQFGILACLVFAFLVPTLLSTSLPVSLSIFPNLMLYILLVFAILMQVRCEEQLVLYTKAILIILVVESFWKYGFAPFRSLLGLPSLAGNGLIYSFHPAFALCLVILLSPIPGFSRRWRLLALAGLAAIIIQAILYEARAGIIAEVTMIALALLGLPSRRVLYLVMLGALLIPIILFNFDVLVTRNVNQSLETLQTAQTENINENEIDPSDLLRLVSANAAWDMYRQRPLTGWGPGMYPILKPQVALGNKKYTIGESGAITGAFNSWLTLLAEMGVISTGEVAILFFLPFLLAFRMVHKVPRTSASYLAFGYSLGLVGLGIHLYFIDLIYSSFAWIFVGLAWASLRIAWEAKPYGKQTGDIDAAQIGFPLSHTG
jgi:O-antigen ligase